jgi:O-antigen/teichoic acid export membrane protein
VFGISLVSFGFRVSGPVIALAVSFAVFGILGFLLDGSLRREFGFDFAIARKLLTFGVWATLASALTALSAQVGILTLTYVRTGIDAAIFKVAMTIAMVPALVGNIVMQPLLPIATRSMKDGAQERSALIRLVIRYLLLLGFPIVGLTVILARAVLSAFFAEPYLAGLGTVRVLVVGNLFVMLSTALSAVLFMGNGVKYLTKMNAVAAAVTVLATLALVRTSGAIGAAVAQLVSSLIVLTLTVAWLRKNVQVMPELKRYSIFALSALESGALAWFASDMVSAAKMKVAVGYLVGGCAYAALVLLQRGIRISELNTLNGIRRAGWQSSGES